MKRILSVLLFFFGVSVIYAQSGGMYFNLGLRYLNSGDLDRAIADYAEVLRLDPDYPGVKQRLEAAQNAKNLNTPRRE